jgi:hypothetical protein
MADGTIDLELMQEPVEVAMLVEGQRLSGAFVANHKRRGVVISDSAQRMPFSASEALVALAWLQEHEAALKAMVAEEVEAVTTVEGLMAREDRPTSRDAVETAPASAEADLRAREARGEIRR